jgi:2-methylisocitrate lyase-like PEP mutase family enzyme
MDDTIRRLQAFEAAGADVLYAPGLHCLEEMRTVTSALKKPFNAVMGFADPGITLAQLGEAGVKRVSIGGGLNRVALKAFMEAAKQMREGNFGFITSMAPMADVRRAFSRVPL